MTGELGILNVGAGDTKLSFDKANPAERARAAKIVEDMLKRGYALLIEVGKDEKGEAIYRRARSFDPKTCEYIIAGDPVVEPPAPIERSEPKMKPVKLKKDGTPDMRGRHAGPRGKRADRRVSAKTHSAVAVGRISGG